MALKMVSPLLGETSKVHHAKRIRRSTEALILFECKKSGGDLSINHASQLFRYFHVTEARFGVLTNGLVYRFFTDLERPNKMDEKPFFEFNILDFKERDVEELKKFAKAVFDLEVILTTANELKYTRAIQTRLAEWMVAPIEDFVRLVSSDLLGNKRFTPAVKDQFTVITRRAFEQLIGEKINERLKGAMTPESTSITEPVLPLATAAAEVSAAAEPLVSTSGEEIEGFHTVRAIVRGLVASKRVCMRDAQSYCAILLDDNNRKPICRLRFNNVEKLRFGVFNDKREEEQFPLTSVDDIHNYAEQLRNTVSAYLTVPDGNGKSVSEKA